MTTDNNARKVHKILDDLLKGNMVLDEEREFLRSALPEPPKQKTLEEITIHVLDAWSCTSDNYWGGDGFDPDVSIEDWLGELHAQLKGLEDEPATVPAPPEFLSTEADYRNAPEGTVAAKGGGLAWLKREDGDWARGDGSGRGSDWLKGESRRVLRWGWGSD